MRWLRARPLALLMWLMFVALCSATTAPAASAMDWRAVRLVPHACAAAGTTFSYAELGSGPPLLLLNGTASPMSEWDPALLGFLADRHRVIVLDYPGIGASGPAPGPWTFPHAAGWISAFLDVIAPGTAVDVLGWSMGGFIAQRLAVQHPAQVRHLVLASTDPGGGATVLGPQWVQDADSDGTSYLRTNYPAGQRGRGLQFLARLDAAAASGAYPPDVIPEATADAMVAAEDPWLRSNGNLRQLGRITAPTLVVTGAQDVVTPPSNSRLIAARIPGARLNLVRDAGHSFLFQQPRQAAALVSAFLTR